MTRYAVKADRDTTIRYGVCDNNDVLVEVYPPNQPAFQQWISPEYILGGQKAKAAGLFPSAFAATLVHAPSPGSSAISAQIAMKTLCQDWKDPGKPVRLVRVTNEGGQCFKEQINVLSGRIEVREIVRCETKCEMKR